MTAVPPEPTAPSYTRLHITPLDPDLVKVVLSAAVLPKARNISYHTLETFPEKRYGFVELPSEDAEKLRKKLHGAVLKGVKLRVEPARPSTMPEPMGDAALASEKPARKDKKAKKDKSKKRKRDGEEIAGVELEDGRKVKRGWTVTEDSVVKDKRDRSKRDKEDKTKKKEKKKSKSKYTNHEECLVRTILPPNRASGDDDGGSSSKKKKDKSREVVIHEFERTEKFPTFLKSTSAAASKPREPAEYVEGKGWVDSEGNVVEAARKRPSPQAVTKSQKSKPAKDVSEEEEEDDSASSDDSSEDGVESATEQLSVTVAASNPRAKLGLSADLPVERRDPLPYALGNLPSSPLAFKSDGRPKSSGSTRSLTIKIPPAASPVTPAPNKVHPLEQLYKKPRNEDGTLGKAESESKGFSFFGNGDAEDEEEEEEEEEDEVGHPPSSQGPQPPMTPYTRQDFEVRNIRSAAPTPDTAHPNRTFKPWSHDDAEDNLDEEPEEDEEEAAAVEGKGDEEDDDERMEDADGPPPAATGEQAAGDFQSWFWEHRGDLNRSWRKRRKVMSKEKRYRDNKARMDRAI